MTPDDHRDIPRRKRRTRGHVIEDLSENYLERQVLLNGHVLRRPERDYGVDVTMFHFADDGEIENGEVRFQLKATDHLKVVDQGSTVSLAIETRDLRYWAMEVYPFILIVFDARAGRAYWLHVQEYVEVHPDSMDPDQKTVQVRIPVANKLTVRSIERFRKKSLQVVANLRNQGAFLDVRKKAR